MTVQECITYFGSKEELAAALDIRLGRINLWLDGYAIPKDIQDYLEEKTCKGLTSSTLSGSAASHKKEENL